ncbi:MAG: 8-amino-7-oxononanoate synthase 2 [Chroococcopsis gigantea SAG 12.99]|jgi:8-amino-7-oxononanoate synthase|nr:8-amino-7-oxononanoate synthase 2 [Chroococcopsis gigantea SAG 12.99]
MTDPYSWIDDALNTIKRAHWYRHTKTLKGLPGPVINVEGETLINFASNDYLGLAGDERLISAAAEAVRQYGTGATGSRLLSGHREIHGELERAIARMKGTEDALVFSSGYLANLGTIAALVTRKDVILGDRYNHSSLKNGAKLSGATVYEYPHRNIEELTRLLQSHRNQYRHCLLITDSVFSMDGDLCPLPEMIGLADTYNCMLLVDEAHATGVLGATGAGCVEYYNCTGFPLIQIGTLSKAIGSLGGYVAGSAKTIDYLRNRAATWIYTTGLSPADTVAATTAIQIIEKEPWRRQKLWENVAFLKEGLKERNLLPSASPILCMEVAKPDQALSLSQRLQEAGIYAPAIRPPTVPTSRIRFSVMATHEKEHLKKLLCSLR